MDEKHNLNRLSKQKRNRINRRRKQGKKQAITAVTCALVTCVIFHSTNVKPCAINVDLHA